MDENRKKVVVMFHVGRSGSGVLGDLLDQHSRIRWAGEIIRKELKQQRLSGEVPQNKRETVEASLAASIGAAKEPVFGFEVKEQHMARIERTPLQFLEFLDQTYAPEYIVLRRKNLLRKIVSSRVAGELKRYHLKRTPEKPTPVNIPPQAARLDGEMTTLKAALERYSTFYSDLTDLLKVRRHLDLTYEQDVQQDPRRAYRRILEFLALPQEDARVRMAVTNPFPLRQMIENYDEVQQALRDTPYFWMLEEEG